MCYSVIRAKHFVQGKLFQTKRFLESFRLLSILSLSEFKWLKLNFQNEKKSSGAKSYFQLNVTTTTFYCNVMKVFLGKDISNSRQITEKV